MGYLQPYPRKIEDGQTGDIAVDHYHRYSEDYQAHADPWAQALCMSLAWPRIIPDSSGKVEQRGLDFYDRLIDSFLEADIMPYVTCITGTFPSGCRIGAGGPIETPLMPFLPTRRL
jgi:beta-glucosidase